MTTLWQWQRPHFFKYLSFLKQKWLFILIALLVAIRMILPSLILPRLNSYLAEFSPIYAIHIGDLDLSILRMAYRFKKTEARLKTDHHIFATIESIDVAIAWRELLRGRILTDVVVQGGNVLLSKPLLNGSQTKEAKPKEDAKEVTNKLFPVRIARVDLHNSSFQFAQLIGDAENDLWRVSEIEGKLINFTPTPKTPTTYFTLKGTMLESSTFKLAGKAERLRKPPALEADLELIDFDLVAANPMLKRLLPLTFTSGHLDLYSEMKMENGKLVGYVKPFFKKIDIIANHEHFVSIKHFLIEIVSAAANLILRKSDDKSLAARIPFHRDPGGKFKVDMAEALNSAVDHGFDGGIKKGFEGSVNLN